MPWRRRSSLTRLGGETLEPRRTPHDYLKAFRAWHLAWAQRELAHRDHFPPEKLDDLGLIYESVIEELREAKEIEERAYDRFLQARDVLSEALRN